MEMNLEPIQDSWLSIGEACRILGVSEATLRQWTDDGQIKVFITPGGHRRYQRSQLDEFMVSRR
ncbi:MAG: helix-turn-helix domain-containing protein, partial [Dehalococcoidales bacterium]|nr:helix-turn-helix domain-containing protein [Dehalococcoidales bacterium]